MGQGAPVGVLLFGLAQHGVKGDLHAERVQLRGSPFGGQAGNAEGNHAIHLVRAELGMPVKVVGRVHHHLLDHVSDQFGVHGHACGRARRMCCVVCVGG